MELKTFEELQGLSVSQLDSYEESFLHENTNYNQTTYHYILKEVSCTNFPHLIYIPAKPLIINVVIAHLTLHFNSINYNVICDLPFKGNDGERLQAFNWCSEEGCFYIYVRERHVQDILAKLTGYEVNINEDDIAWANGILSQAHETINIATEKDRLLWYLNYLHIDTFVNSEIPLYSRVLDEGEPVYDLSEGVADNIARFSSAIWRETIEDNTIILAGVGGIGSWTALMLSRLQPKAIFLYDDDFVEEVNMAGQFYPFKAVGRRKTEAIAALMEDFSKYKDVFSIQDRFTMESEPGDIMICGFDNMLARKTFFCKWAEHVQSKPEPERKKCLFIDGRMSAELLQVFCIRGDDAYNMALYQQRYLFDDEEADETVCSYKQTSFIANMIGSIICNLFVNFAANEVVEDLRPLPFFTSYDASMMLLNMQD